MDPAVPTPVFVALAFAAAALVGFGIHHALRRGPVKRFRRRLRTARAAREWARPAVPAARPVPSRVIVSMTTSPARLADGLERSVRTLLNQTCPPDEIHLNVPHVFRRTGEPYVLPAWCATIDPRVRVFRVDDVGPATKTVPTIERIPAGEDVVVVVADDDVLYLQESIEHLLRAMAERPGTVVGFSGYDLGPGWESQLAKGTQPVQLIEGWACYAAHRSAFGTGFAEHVARANECRACFCHDDVVVSNWFELQGAPRLQVQTSAVNRRRMRRMGAQLDYGYLPGALHQESSGASRARDAARHLAAMGLWKLRSPPLDAEVRVG
jgi:hypothetical protein